MRTAGRCPPLMLTRPTPGNCEIFCARRVSARSSTWVSGIVLEVNAKVRIGASAGLTLAYIGGAGRSDGNRLPAALIAAWTSCSATSRLRSRLNCSVMTEAPAELVDDIWLRPGICPNCTSGGAHFNSDNSRITERGRSRGASPLAATLPLLIVLRLGGALSGGVRDLLACRWRLSGGGVRDTGLLGRGQRHLGA